MKHISNIEAQVRLVLYRPFDLRHCFYHSSVFMSLRRPVMKHIDPGRPNILLITSKMTKGETFQHVTVSRHLAEAILLSSKTSNNALPFPLYLYSDIGDQQRVFETVQHRSTNLSSPVIGGMSELLHMEFVSNGSGDLFTTFGPEDVFHYIYAVLHSPAYRSRYSEFLRIDYPRIPSTSDADLFRKLRGLGSDLVALHLLDARYSTASWNLANPKRRSPLQIPVTNFAGSGPPEVAKGYPKFQEGSVFINSSHRFSSVPEEVWNFHVGGYQVCEKWLKDRRGRTLSDEDIAHYQLVVVALNETIRLMAEIDAVIEEHGGWPLPGSQDPATPSEPDQLPFAKAKPNTASRQ